MKKIPLLLLGAIITLNLFSQQPTTLLNRLPEFPKVTTPNAASFNKFIDNPISLYSGTPDVSIPLYTLKDINIELPIILRYNTTGIKVDEEASWVGLGWNLNMGGVITRNTVGDSDDYDNTPGYLNIISKMNVTQNIVQTYFAPVYTKAIHDAISCYIDGGYCQKKLGRLNPDVFYFSFPGGSGKFIIDYRNDSIYILNRDSNLKIEKVSNLIGYSAYDFMITTPEGIKHYFGYFSSLSDTSSPTVASSMSYVLSESVYPNGQVIKYDYDKYACDKYSYSNFYQYILPTSGLAQFTGTPYDNQNGTKNTMKGDEFNLKKITTTNYTISFETSTRTDFLNGRKLDQIKVQPISTPDQVKEYNFVYSYFEGNANMNQWNTGVASDLAVKRLKLNSIYQKNSTEINDKYEFMYNNTQLPRKDSYAMDYWGYYNGVKTNTTFIPDLKYSLWGQLKNVQIKRIANTYIYNTKFKAIRAPEYSYCKAGILEGIKYPTGGYTEFKYESNTFDDYYIPTVTEIENDLYLKAEIFDQNYTTDPKTTSFTLEEETELDISIYLTHGLNTWYQVQYHSIQIRKQGTLIKEYCYAPECVQNQMNNNSSSSITKNEKITLEAGSYTIISDFPDALGNQYGSALNHGLIRANITYPKAVKTTESQGAGLRVSNISHFSSTVKDNLLLSTSYKYVNSTTGKSSGILHEKIAFYNASYNVQNEVVVGDGTPVNGEPQTFLLALDLIELSGNNRIANPYGSVSPVGYSFVKEIREGQNNNGYTTYQYINQSPTTSTESIRIDNPQNGKPTKIEFFDNTNKLLKRESNSYKQSPTLYYWGINLIDNLNKYPMIFNGNGSTLVSGSCLKGDARFYNGILGVRLNILMHALNSYDITLTNKEILADGVSRIEEYTYNPGTLQLKTKKIITENTNILSYEYTYPNDLNCGIYKTMTDAYMLSPIIEEKLFRNLGYIGGSVMEFSLNKSSKVVPAKKSFSELTSKLTSPVTFSCSGINRTIFPSENVLYKESDSYGNPTYIIHNDITSTIYIWGYGGQFLIAEIKNATYDQVKAALGGATPESLSSADTPNATLINGLRTNANLIDALVTTYTYKPLVGILTATDPRGVITYYDYDTFGRLKETYIIENNVKKIIQVNDYHYQNQ